jgi:hypothetical protein
MAENQETVRDAISAAYDKLEKGPEAPTPEVPAPEVVATPEQPIGVQTKPDDRPRDEKGRYLSADKVQAKIGEPPPKVEEPPKEPEAEKPPAEPPPTPEKPVVKVRAPATWKPTAREGWDKVPSDIQQEVIRRERETALALQETAEARQTYQKLQEVIKPYEPLIRAEGVEPIQAINNLFRTTAMLATGPAQTKAQIVAGIIKTYGVDIPTLDALLAGQPAPNGPQQPSYQPYNPEQFRDPRLDALLERADKQMQEKAASQIAEIEGEEFFEDVREDVADILDLAAKRGVAMNARDAYNRAVSFNPEVSKVLEQRKAAANQVSTQRSMAAAASVRPQPAAGPVASPERKTWRDELEAAMDKHSRSSR